MFYVLEKKQPVPVADAIAWSMWHQDAVRNGAHVVAQDDLGGCQVSTVFLGVDHAFLGGPPVLFETMVFGGERDGDMERYCTWEEAEAGHTRWLTRLAS